MSQSDSQGLSGQSGECKYARASVVVSPFSSVTQLAAHLEGRVSLQIAPSWSPGNESQTSACRGNTVKTKNTAISLVKRFLPLAVSVRCLSLDVPFTTVTT